MGWTYGFKEHLQTVNTLEYFESYPKVVMYLDNLFPEELNDLQKKWCELNKLPVVATDKITEEVVVYKVELPVKDEQQANVVL